MDQVSRKNPKGPFGCVGLGFILLVWALTHSQPPSKPGSNDSIRPDQAKLNALPTEDADAQTPEAVKAARRATVFIRLTAKPVGNEIKLGEGSGFLAAANGDQGYVVTNAHVVSMQDPERIEVTFSSGTRSQRTTKAVVLVKHPTLDLAILKVVSSALPAPLVCSTVNIPESQLPLKATVVGFPGGSHHKDAEPLATIHQGILFKMQTASEYVFKDLKVEKGSSGSPVLDPFGEVIGVLKSANETYAGAISSQEVAKMLESEKKRPVGK